MIAVQSCPMLIGPTYAMQLMAQGFRQTLEEKSEAFKMELEQAKVVGI